MPSIERDATTGIAEAFLPNGLRVLVLERPEVPVVSHHVWYKVGSSDEKPGETGLAHYLEHVMFKGTQQIRKGDIDRLTFQAGGSNNATTWNDHTNYYFNFAADRWRLALEIESDRMRNCSFVPKEFEAERGAVLNEMHASHDSPAGRLDEEVDAAGYMVHPYHHSTIGWQQEVEEVARSTVIDFYDRHYMPNNATLVVVGAVTAEDVVSAAAEAFADVAPGTLPPPVTLREPVQRGERRVVIVEDIDAPRVEIAWTTCRVGDDDDYNLDIVAAVLGGGKSSRLHRRLVEIDRTCTDVSVWNETRKYPGRFKVWCDGQQGVDPRVIEHAVHEEIARFVAEGPTAAEVEKARNNLLARDVFSKETAAGIADRIGSFETVRSWKLYGEWPVRIVAVTPEMAKAAAARYLTPTGRTVGWAVSPEVAALATPRPDGVPVGPPVPIAVTDGDVSARKAEPPEEPNAQPTYEGGRRRPLDLNVPRGAGSESVLSPEAVTLGNGLRVLLLTRRDLPVVSMQMHISAGPLVESRPGLASITGDLLSEGAGGRSSEEIANILDFLGASLGSGGSGVSARCLSKDTEVVFGLLADVVRKPHLDAGELEKVRAVILSDLSISDLEPVTVGRKAFLDAVYGGHPYGRLSQGDADSVTAITLDDVKAHHARWFSPDRSVLAVVGDFDVASMKRWIEARFGDWKPTGATSPALPELTARTEPVVIQKPMAGKNQSVLFMGNVAIRRNDPDYAALLVMDHILGTGPGFSDRLSKDLRDEQGLAYTVYGRTAYNSGEEPGTFTGYIACLGDDLQRAMEGMRGHIRRIREEPVSEEELADAKSYLTGSLVFRYETTGQMASALIEMERFGLGFDYPARFQRDIAAVTREDIQRVARKHLHEGRMVTVVAGATE
jgi:zinc protease